MAYKDYSMPNNSHYKMRIYYAENSTNIANNTSNVTITLAIYSDNSSYTYWGNTYGQITVDGVFRTQNTINQTINTSGATICQWQGDISHNADGTKTTKVTCGISAGVPGEAINSFDWTLSTIPRDFTSTPSISKGTVTPNAITVNWSTSQTCDLIKYKLGSGSWVQVWTGSATSGSFTISGLTFDTSYTITGNFRRKDSQRAMNSNSITVKTLARPIKIRVNGAWKDAIPYVRVNGTWKKAQAYIRVNNTWKEGK